MRLRITTDGWLIFDKVFVESDHPRGQPGNKGEFAKSSSGSIEVTSKSDARTRHLATAPAARADWPEHIKALKVPPAWTDVKISKDPDAACLVVGKDAAGRRQAIYSKRFQDSQSAAKFSRITELDRKFVSIYEQNEANRRSSDPIKREHADCVALIMSMGVRPGSDEDTKSKTKAYGATTLEGRHVMVEDGTTYLRFVGKKGVALNLPVTDQNLATSLRARASSAGADGRLFGKVSASSLLNYVHGFDGGASRPRTFGRCSRPRRHQTLWPRCRRLRTRGPTREPCSAWPSTSRRSSAIRRPSRCKATSTR